MLAIVVHSVVCFDPVCRMGLVFARIQIAVKAREIAAGYLQAELVPSEEDVARRP